MGLLGSLVMRYAAEGHQEVIRADRRVRDSVSETARHAQRDEGKTKGWLQRHMTALLGVAAVIGAAMYTIARESPSMSAAIGEIRLAFSMFFMDIGERAAPFFEELAKVAWDLLDEWDKLPEGLKNILVRGWPAVLEEWDGLLLDIAARLDQFFGTGDAFQTLTKGVIDTVKNISNTLSITLSEIAVGMFDTLRTNWEAFKEDPIAWGVGLVTGFVQGIRNQVVTLYNYVIGILGKVAGMFLNWLPDAQQWGVDLMTNFINGLRSMFGLLSSTIATIKSMIEDVLSFDVTANDRMAYRWGSDLVQHFEAGMRSVRFAPDLPVAAPVPAALSGEGGSRGGDTYITIESGAIQVMGAEAKTFDERSIGRIVRDEIGQALRERTR